MDYKSLNKRLDYLEMLLQVTLKEIKELKDKY